MALKVTGVCLSSSLEEFSYTSRKTNQREQMTRGTVILQGDYGVLVCTSFNPTAELPKQGQKVVVDLVEFKVDNGLQRAVIHL